MKLEEHKFDLEKVVQGDPNLQEASPMNFLTSSMAALSARAASRAAWCSSESSRTTGTTRLVKIHTIVNILVDREY